MYDLYFLDFSFLNVILKSKMDFFKIEYLCKRILTQLVGFWEVVTIYIVSANNP
jgi:hypothetical protein